MRLLSINGFQVLHVPTPNDLITVRAVVYAGSGHESSPDDLGAAHFLEHMFFKGSREKDCRELNRTMAGLGGHNAYTNFDRTLFFINTTAARLRDAADTLAELVFTPAMREEDFERERGVILEELQTSEDSPPHVFYYGAFAKIFGERIGHRIIGTKDSVSMMTVGHVNAFRGRHYVRDRLLFIVCGNVSESEAWIAMELALRRGDDCQTISVEQRPVAKLDLASDPYHFNHRSEQAFLGIYMRGTSTADSKAFSSREDIFNNALGGGSHSTLFTRLRDEMGLCYSIGSYEDGFSEARSTVIQTQLKAENIHRAREAIADELDKVCRDGFPEGLLDIAISNAIYSVTKRTETSSGYAACFADDYLEHRKHFSDEELSPKRVRQKYFATTATDMIEHARWIREAGSRLICMNG